MCKTPVFKTQLRICDYCEGLLVRNDDGLNIWKQTVRKMASSKTCPSGEILGLIFELRDEPLTLPFL